MSLLLVAVMAVSMFTACGSSNKDDANNDVADTTVV